MKTLKILILIVLLILVAGCSQIDRGASINALTITGSGNIVSREVAISGFEQVETGLTFDLTIRQGEHFSVVLSSDDNFVDYLQVEQAGKNISLGFLPGYAYDIHGVTLRAEITMPELVRLSLSGSSHATLEGFTAARDLEFELSGSSFVDGYLEAEISSFKLTGGTYLKLAGSTENMRLDTCGNSVTDLSQFEAREAIVEASCASTIIVKVEEILDIEASQNSQILYVGQPDSSDIKAYESAHVGQK